MISTACFAHGDEGSAILPNYRAKFTYHRRDPRVRGELSGYQERRAAHIDPRGKRAGAAAVALRAFRNQGVLDSDSLFDVPVDVLTKTTHAVSLAKLRAWLESNAADPNTQAAKRRLK